MGNLASPNRTVTRHAPVIATNPLIGPLCIFGAGRQSFDVIVRQLAVREIALDLIFDALPLAEHGWVRDKTTAIHFNSTAGPPPLWPVWRVGRG